MVSFGIELRQRKCLTKLRDKRGAVMTEERIVADIARSHFESLGRGNGKLGLKRLQIGPEV